MKQGISIGLAALLLGSAGGFIVGKSTGSSADTSSADQSVVNGDPRLIRESRLSGSEGSRRTRAENVEDAMSESGQLARLQSLMDLYAGMDAAQLEAAAEGLENMPMADRMMASMLLYSQWGEIDPQGALAHANSMGFGGMIARPTILRSWASVDPVNAAKYYSENPDEFGGMGGRGGFGGGGENGAGVIALEWAKLDPQAAMAWAQGLEGRDKSSAVVSVIGEMAAKDPAEAASVAASLEEGDRNRAYSEIAQKWALTDFASAEAWINTLSGQEKQDAMGSAIGVLANSDPVGASQKIASMEQGREKSRAIRDVASSWARESPAAAAEWVSSQEGGEDGIRSVMGTWVGQDSAAALSFVESQPEGGLRDSAAQAYIWSSRDAAPQETLALAETISDERDRSRTIGMTAMRWMREDEAAARAYIEQSSGLSDQAKERILSGNQRGGGQRGQRGGNWGGN